MKQAQYTPTCWDVLTALSQVQHGVAISIQRSAVSLWPGEAVIGGIFIDGQDAGGKGARLRWFILAPAYQGRGLGNRLMEAAIGFCRAQGFHRVYLTTFAGLNAARHLYEKSGFRLCGEEDGRDLTGSAALVEQVFELILAG